MRYWRNLTPAEKWAEISGMVFVLLCTIPMFSKDFWKLVM